MTGEYFTKRGKNGTNGVIELTRAKTILKNRSRYNSYYKYQIFLRDELINAMNTFFNNDEEMDKIFSISSEGLKDKNTSLETLMKAKARFDKNVTYVKVNCSRIVNGLHELMKESYADLVMIQLLNVTMEDYVLSFYKPLYHVNHDPKSILSKNNIGERIASVLKVYNYNVNDLNFDILKEKMGEVDDGAEKLMFESYLKELSTYFHKTNIDTPVEDDHDQLADQTVIYNTEYLFECRLDLYGIIRKDDSRVQDIRELYKALNYKSIFDNISQIKQYIATYMSERL